METEVARAGAKWWADILRDGAKLDNADPSDAGAMTFMMAKMAQMDTKKRQDEGQYQRFEDELANALEQLDDRRLYVGVDYHPCAVLADAAARAELVCDGITTFPWKTGMSFNDGVITAAYGYGAPTKQIYPTATSE